MNFYKEHPFLCKLITIVSIIALIAIYLGYGYKISEWASSFEFNSSDTTRISYPHDVDPDDATIQTDIISNRTLYEADFIEIATGTHIVPRLVTTSGNCLYYVTMEGESSENAESYTIWCENFENNHTTEQITQLPTDNQIMQITVDKEHNIYIFTKTKVDISAGEISRYYMTKYKKTGDVVLHKEITEDIVCDEQPQQDKRYYDKLNSESYFLNTYYKYSIYDIAGAGIDKNGTIYVANRRGVTAFNSKGKKLFWIDETNNINSFIRGKNGNTYAVSSTSYDNRFYNYATVAYDIRSINLYSKLSKTIYDFPHYITSDENILHYASESICSSGMNYDMLTASIFGLYGVNIDKRTAHEILLWANAGVDGQDIDYFAELADGRFLTISHCFDDSPVEVAVINPVKATPENQQKIITVGVRWVDQYIQNAVVAYNNSQDDYLVQLVLADSVAQGSQCDIFAIDGNSPMAEQYVAEGKIEDLTPYFEASSKVNTEDFIPSVVEAHTYDDVLIGIPSTVYLKPVEKESTGETADWTLEELQKILDSNPDLKRQLDAYTVAYTLVYYNCYDFVNWEERTCNLYNDSSEEKTDFEKIIDYARTFPLEASDNNTLPTGFMKSNVNLYNPNIHSIRFFYGYMEDYYSDIVNNIDEYTGLLRDNGMTYCISALSENKTEAWQFLESLLSASSDPAFRFGSEVGYLDTSFSCGEGIPTRIDMLEDENLCCVEFYGNDYTEEFMHLVSNSTYMKYNICVHLMDWIGVTLLDTLDTDVEISYIHSVYQHKTAIEYDLPDYINNYH